MKVPKLTPHPEGGRFAEVYRSKQSLKHPSGSLRSALTHIYFELGVGETSGFHKVTSDEVWNVYRGGGVHLYLWDPIQKQSDHVTLSSESDTYCYVVPAGIWQAAEPVRDSVLVGCSVAPGFDFEDFTMLKKEDPECQELLNAKPEWSPYIKA
jgi:predicted cupin superfamily sugar epimerase